MADTLEWCLWRIRKPYYERKKSRWRKKYVGKQLESEKNRMVRLAALLLSAAELLYGTVWVVQNPEVFLHTIGIQVMEETGEKQGWNITKEGICWGIRIRQDGIEVYREENSALAAYGAIGTGGSNDPGRDDIILRD